MPLSPKLLALLQGDPFGSVFPPKPNIPGLAVDGRTVALTILRDYITSLDFFRPMASGLPPDKFNIKPENFHIEWPDSVEDLKYPAVTIVHDRAPYGVIGLTTYIEEESRDVFLPGTVVAWQSEYQEVIQLEVHASKIAERRSILAAIEEAMSPTEQLSGLRFRMPDYFNELVCFTLYDRELMDSPDSAKNRRRAQMGIHMRFNIVRLVRYAEFDPRVLVNAGIEVTVNEQNPFFIP